MNRLHSLQFWAAFPLLLPQALWVKRTALRLPPALGPRHGIVNVGGRPLKLLALGDSIVAGVGIEELFDAMPGRLVSALFKQTGRPIHWRAMDLNGARCAQVQQAFSADPGEAADIVFVSVGVNDVTGLRTQRAWHRDVCALLIALTQHAPQSRIVLAEIPPLDVFPALPTPLRQLLGHRSRELNAIAAEVVRDFANVIHLPTPVPDDPSLFASDGFHPNSRSCAIWAEAVIRAALTR